MPSKYTYTIATNGTAMFFKTEKGKKVRVSKDSVPKKIVSNATAAKSRKSKTPKRKTSAKRTSSKRSSKKRQSSSKRRSSRRSGMAPECKKFSLSDMRALAKARGVKGYSKMDKFELCGTLGTDLHILQYKGRK